MAEIEVAEQARHRRKLLDQGVLGVLAVGGGSGQRIDRRLRVQCLGHGIEVERDRGNGLCLAKDEFGFAFGKGIAVFAEELDFAVGGDVVGGSETEFERGLQRIVAGRDLVEAMQDFQALLRGAVEHRQVAVGIG